MPAIIANMLRVLLQGWDGTPEAFQIINAAKVITLCLMLVTSMEPSPDILVDWLNKAHFLLRENNLELHQAFVREIETFMQEQLTPKTATSNIVLLRPDGGLLH